MGEGVAAAPRAGEGGSWFSPAAWFKSAMDFLFPSRVAERQASQARTDRIQRQESEFAESLELRPLTAEELSLMQEIFPSLEAPHFNQRSIGDCYLLAYLHALVKRPYGRHVVARMIRKEGDHWMVKFADCPEEIAVYESDFNDRVVYDARYGGNVVKQLARGDTGFNVLEVAFGRRRKMLGLDGPRKQGDTFLATEGGWLGEASAAVMGPFATSEMLYVEVARRQVLDSFAAFDGSRGTIVLNAATPWGEPRTAPPPWYRGHHMYNVVDVDTDRRTVTVSNPHGSESMVTTMSYDDFFKYFFTLEVEIASAERLKSEFRRRETSIQEGIYNFRLSAQIPHLYTLGRRALRIELYSGGFFLMGADSYGNIIIDTVHSWPGVSHYLIRPGESFSFGRANFADDDRVSSRHFSISNLGLGRFTITDLGSTNGVTVVNEEVGRPGSGRLAPNVEHVFDQAHLPQEICLGVDYRISCRRAGNRVFLEFPDGQTTCIEDGASIVVGRLTTGGSSTVSARHASIENRGGKLVVKDLGSTNGTYVR
jgi:hypothetical protein